MSWLQSCHMLPLVLVHGCGQCSSKLLHRILVFLPNLSSIYFKWHGNKRHSRPYFSFSVTLWTLKPISSMMFDDERIKAHASFVPGNNHHFPSREWRREKERHFLHKSSWQGVDKNSNTHFMFSQSLHLCPQTSRDISGVVLFCFPKGFQHGKWERKANLILLLN